MTTEYVHMTSEEGSESGNSLLDPSNVLNFCTTLEISLAMYDRTDITSGADGRSALLELSDPPPPSPLSIPSIGGARGGRTDGRTDGGVACPQLKKLSSEVCLSLRV